MFQRQHSRLVSGEEVQEGTLKGKAAAAGMFGLELVVVVVRYGLMMILLHRHVV